jgi:hypothetical protein
MNQKAVLLATIEAALEFRAQSDPLPAQEVSRLGQQLGLSDESTYDFIRQLSAEGKVNQEWGGAVRSARTEPSARSVYLGPNATYVGERAQVQNSAVGASAHVQIAPQSFQMTEEGRAQIVAWLTVPIEKLTVELASMTQAQQETYRQLIEPTKVIQQQLLPTEKADKNILAEKLGEADKALGVLEKAGKLGTAAAPYLPQLWNMLHHAFQSLSGYLGSL